MPQVTCSCGSVYQANDAHIGKKLKCGNCGRLVDIVMPSQSRKSGPTWRQHNTGPSSAGGAGWNDNRGYQRPSPQWEVPNWQQGPGAGRGGAYQDPNAPRGGPPPRDEYHEDDRPQRRRRFQADDDAEIEDEGNERPARAATPSREDWDSSRGVHPYTRRMMIYVGGALFLLFAALLAGIYQGQKTKPGVIQVQGGGDGY